MRRATAAGVGSPPRSKNVGPHAKVKSVDGDTGLVRGGLAAGALLACVTVLAATDGLDPAQILVRHVNATITPQAAILSPDGKLLYLGPIDNRVEDLADPKLGGARA